MKLRTDMQDGCVHARGGCVDEDAASLDVATDLVHDAAAAHALMQASNELKKDPWISNYAPNGYAGWIIDRATEIMQEWGFGEDYGQ